MIECTSATACLGDMVLAPESVKHINGAEGNGDVPMPAQFDGNENDATLAGWEENEFGWVCPKCVDDDFSDEESTGNALTSGEDDDLQKLMVAAAAHSNVSRIELAKQAFERGVDGSNRINYEAILGYINDLPEGHRDPVREIVLGTVEAMGKAKLNGKLLVSKLDNYDEAVQALK